MKFLIIGSRTKMHINFRGDLIKEISNKGYDVVSICPQEGYEEELEKLGSRFIKAYNKKDKISPLDNIKYFCNLYKIIKKEKPDKVLAYTIKPVIFGCIAAKMAGVKEIYALITGLGFVYTVRSIKTKIIRVFTRLGYERAFKYCKKVILQNVDDKKDLVKNKYITEEKVEVVSGSGVNMQRFEFCNLPEQMNFLMISRMIKSKGIKEYLEAAKIIKEKYKNIKFIFIGAMDSKQDAISKEELETYINDGIVEYHEETNDVQSFIKRCKVYVLPSYYREGIPRTLLEALSMGRPIITTDSIGCRETVIEGKNGFLIKTKNVEQLVEKMEWCINNKNKLQDMGKESYKYCKKRFDVHIINNEMMKIMKI